MKRCDECEKYSKCTSLCASAEKYVNQDYVSMNKFPAAKRYPEGSERYWNGHITLDWIYSHCGLDDAGNCATLERTLNIGIDLGFLSENERSIIELYYFEGKKLVEIIEILGIPKGSVFGFFARAKEKIKEKYADRV